MSTCSSKTENNFLVELFDNLSSHFFGLLSGVPRVSNQVLNLFPLGNSLSGLENHLSIPSKLKKTWKTSKCFSVKTTLI